MISRLTETLRCYEKGLKAAQELNKQREEGVFLYATAVIYKKRGRFDEAEENIQKAYETLDKLNDSESRKSFSDVVHEMGMMALDKGEYPNQSEFTWRIWN